MLTIKNIFCVVKQLSLTVLCAFALMSFSITGTTDPEPYAVKLPAGTSIPLETTRMISSETLEAGQMVDLRVVADIKVDGKVVVAAGSMAKGQVVRSEKSRALGRQGRIEIQIKSVKSVDGQDIPLSGGSLYKEGEDKQTLAIALGILLCILCLLIKGKEAVFPIGTSVSANVAANSEIEVK